MGGRRWGGGGAAVGRRWGGVAYVKASLHKSAVLKRREHRAAAGGFIRLFMSCSRSALRVSSPWKFKQIGK